MTVTVLDTAAGMRRVLDAPAGRRADVLREVLAPAAGMYRWFPGDVDLAQVHAAGLGFPLDRRADDVRAALDALVAADVWHRAERALADAIALQTRTLPGITVPDLTVLLVLGDPDDAFFTGPARGLSGNGSVTGFLQLVLWPTATNLARVEAAVVHELHHNLRYAPGGVVWDPATVTVAEHVVSEGLADAFARQMYGDELGHTPFAVPHLADDAVLDAVVRGLDLVGMQHLTAWVLGDEAAERFGVQPVGLPMGAGYAAGTRLVDRYLTATGRTAAQALHVPGREVVDVALAGPTT